MPGPTLPAHGEGFMLRIVLLVVIALAAAMAVRTLQYAPPEEAPPSRIDVAAIDLDEAGVLRRLGEAVQFRTVSKEPPEPIDVDEFEAFLAWLPESYPRVFEAVEAERVGGYTLLLRWPGAEPALAPVLFAGHYDVVPVIEGTEALWTHPPFAGRVADGYLWGRGALDNKNGVIGLLEAVNWLVERGEQPRRTIYFSFGHDEELGGAAGAAAVAARLAERGVRLAWSLDEGSFVFLGMFPGVDRPIATINTAEKGSVNVRIIASAEGGHSSMPPAETAVGRLAHALVALERNPMPGGLEGLAAETFDAVGPYMPWLPRTLFANRWLFGPLVEYQLAELPFANAMLRTTTAPTMLSASPKVNVLPIEAVATVNFRIHPRDSVEDVVRHVRRVVASAHVRVEAEPGSPASPVADSDSEGFRLIAEAVRAEFEGVIVAPGLLVAATDSRHYATVADNAFRFNPMVVTPDLVAAFHGTDERISTEGMLKGVRTYVRLLRRL
jgi:carboxypeptidase PM20D1